MKTTVQNTHYNGYLLLYKSPGLTSFQSLSMVKKALSTGKVGHTGTLDKFAEGLLIVLAGWCTKLIPWFLNCDKTYQGIIKFGTETDTLDPEGKIIKECGIPSREKIEAAIPQFIGKIMQAPPAYSSVHINGKRAYQLAREGTDVPMKERPVEIYDLQLEKYEDGEGLINVACSKGTYIRSLARDLANAADSCAHLTYLNRTSIAGFSLEEAVNPSSTESDPHEAVRKALKPVDKKMFEALNIPAITVDNNTADAFINGKPIHQIIDTSQITLICTEYHTAKSASISQNTLACTKNHTKNDENLAIFRENGVFVGVIYRQNKTWRYGYMYANN